MIEQTYRLYQGSDKTIEKVLMDENVHYLHMVLNRQEGLPEHVTNATVYMTVLRGVLTIALEDQETHEYPGSTLLKIPQGTKMNAKNLHEGTLELIVVKAPAPR